MKKLTIILLLSIGSLQAQDKGYLLLSNETMQFDKQKHMLGGMFIGGVSYIYFEQQGNSELDAYFKSASVVLGISLLKEANDKWLGDRAFSVDDIGATMLGQFVGGTTALLWRRHVRNRQVKRQEKLEAKLAHIDSFYE